jgi:hypothetical protein
MSKAKTITVSEQFFKGSQDLNYERIVKVPTTETDSKGFYITKKVKVVLKRDSYDAQSYARVYLFDGAKWNFVYEEPLASCQMKSISPYQRIVSKDDFLPDANRILKIALEIID